MPNDTLPSDPAALRERLMSVALPYAEMLKGRPGLVGILLYGSLVRGDLTPFSDVDLALFYEGEPPHEIEHYLVDSVKVDFIAFPMAKVTALLDPLPRSLDAGFPFSYVLKALLTPGDEGILYDPTGELRRVKAGLNAAVSYESLNRVSLSDGYHNFYRPNLEATRSLLEGGDWAGALDKAKWCGFALSLLAREKSGRKETRDAAQDLGIPDFADRREELASLAAPPEEAAEAVWAATQALWEYTLKAVEPLKVCLRAQGVDEPDRLELAGKYDLFWPEAYLVEFGRNMGEVGYALKRSRYDLDHGRGQDALQHLWGCRGTEGVRQRWERLAAALKDTGYDCAPVIEPMLADAEFARLGERLDAAIRANAKGEATPELARRALGLVEEMERRLVAVIPFMSAEELGAAKGDPAG